MREALRLEGHRLAVGGGAGAAELTRALAAPALQATVPDLEFAHTVLMVGCEPLDDAPILDLRIRKGVRRSGVAAGDRHRPPERPGPQRQADPALRRPATRPGS